MLEARSKRPSDGDNLSDGALFRVHFDNLPGPAYMWQRDGDEFRLVAHNRAAGALPLQQSGQVRRHERPRAADAAATTTCTPISNSARFAA